jgi:hypothetical protein
MLRLNDGQPHYSPFEVIDDVGNVTAYVAKQGQSYVVNQKLGNEFRVVYYGTNLFLAREWMRSNFIGKEMPDEDVDLTSLSLVVKEGRCAVA